MAIRAASTGRSGPIDYTRQRIGGEADHGVDVEGIGIGGGGKGSFA